MNRDPIALFPPVMPECCYRASSELFYWLRSVRNQFSVWVNGNWRIIFRFIGDDVELVDYLDYH